MDFDGLVEDGVSLLNQGAHGTVILDLKPIDFEGVRFGGGEVEQEVTVGDESQHGLLLIVLTYYYNGSSKISNLLYSVLLTASVH